MEMSNSPISNTILIETNDEIKHKWFDKEYYQYDK